MIYFSLPNMEVLDLNYINHYKYKYLIYGGM